jgi:hypothetical protein
MRARLIAAVWLAAACSAHRGGAGGSADAATASAAPHIDGIQPDSVVVAQGSVVEVVVRGRGFVAGMPGHNIVMFGRHAINDVPANANGTEIRLVIPDRLPSGGEAPPQPIEPGPYPITVKTPNGESNAVNVRVYR